MSSHSYMSLHMKHSRVSASPRQTQHQCRPVSSAYGNLAAVQGHAGPATACKAVCWDKHAKVSKVSSRGAAVTAQAAACGHNNSLLETPARAYPGWKSRALGGLAARSSAAAEVSTMRGWAAAAMNANATNRRRLVATRATSGGGEHHVESEEDHAYVVMWPRDFAEGAAAVAAMRSGNQSVVLNIGRICADTPGRSRETEQQRLVDFIAGRGAGGVSLPRKGPHWLTGGDGPGCRVAKGLHGGRPGGWGGNSIWRFFIGGKKKGGGNHKEN